MKFYNIPQKSIFNIPIAFMVLLASVRGFLIIHFDFNANLTYKMTAIILMLISLYGCCLLIFYRDKVDSLLKKILYINSILFFINIGVDLALGQSFPIQMLYLFISPFIIAVFLYLPNNLIYLVIVLISLFISLSVISNFVNSLNIDGYQILSDYYRKLRPSTFVSLSLTGEYIRVGGYTGNYHDSANILGMTTIFFFSRFIVKKYWPDLFIYLISASALLLTQSATNIIVEIFLVLLSTCYFLIKFNNKKNNFFIIITYLFTFIIWFEFKEYFTIFYERVDEAKEWREFLASTLNSGESLQRSASTYVFPMLGDLLILGHATAFESKHIHTEIGLYGIILQLGMLHSAVFFSLMLYPVWIFFKLKTVCLDTFPSILAVIFGFLSLLHYGSITRITSIYLFCLFFALSIAFMNRHRSVI